MNRVIVVTQHSVFHGPSFLLCVLLYLYSGVANATCSWNGQNSTVVNIQVPSYIALTPQVSVGEVLASGDINFPELTCNDGEAQSQQTSWLWNSGTDAGQNLRQVSPGIGIRLKWAAANSGESAYLSSGSGLASTGDFNWSSLHWELIRISGTIIKGQQVAAGVLGQGNIISRSDNSSRDFVLQLANAATITAVCSLSVDKSLVLLPDTDANILTTNGYSGSVPLNAYVTCPTDTTLPNGTNLRLATSQADITDNSLVGNAGNAQGVAIEILNGNKRVSAQDGRVEQTSFTQGVAGTTGATETLNVRMSRLPGQKVTAGSVRGTFTLTLSVN